MFNGRRSARSEVELKRANHELSLKLVRANAALRLKTLYAERLEFLSHQRTETIDELNGKLDSLRQRNWHLEIQAECLCQMIAAPQLRSR